MRKPNKSIRRKLNYEKLIAAGWEEYQTMGGIFFGKEYGNLIFCIEDMSDDYTIEPDFEQVYVCYEYAEGRFGKWMFQPTSLDEALAFFSNML